MILKKVIRSCKHPFSRRSYRGSRHLQLLCFLVCQTSSCQGILLQGLQLCGTSSEHWKMTLWKPSFRALSATGKHAQLPESPGLDGQCPLRDPEHWLFKKPQEALRGPRSDKQSFPQRSRGPAIVAGPSQEPGTRLQCPHRGLSISHVGPTTAQRSMYPFTGHDSSSTAAPFLRFQDLVTSIFSFVLKPYEWRLPPKG